MRSIPADLAHAQQQWQATYRQLAAAPRTALRRRLIHLSSKALFHPYWEGNGATARAALFASGWGGGR